MATTKNRPLTFDHLKSLKAPRRKVVSVYGSDEALEAVKDIENRLRDASDVGLRANLEQELQAAKDALEASTIKITLQSIGRKRYEELVAEHPPTKEQNEESQKATGQDSPYNTDTFPPALLAATIIEPELTVEQAQEIWDDWNTGELMDLFFAAIEVNTMRRSGLGKEFGEMND